MGEMNVQHTGPVSVIKLNDKKTSNDLYVLVMKQPLPPQTEVNKQS
jgi:hypothetical protein